MTTEQDTLPTTQAGWLHRCDQRFAEGYEKGRASAAQGAEPVGYVTAIEEGKVLMLPRASLDAAGLVPIYAGPSPKAGERDQWMNDYFTLLGDAELRRMNGETDMPNYLLELAERISTAHLDEGYAQRVRELRALAAAPAAPKEGDRT